MKKIFLIATGGTIASRHTKAGLLPQISGEELLSFIPEAKKFCRIDVVQPFSLDSTNVHWEHWLVLGGMIRDHYDQYDGFVICHGTDTMAYTAAALSYLVRYSRKPIVVTGAQRPIDLPEHLNIEVADGARLHLDFAGTNVVNSLRIAGKSYVGEVSLATRPELYPALSGPGTLMITPKGSLLIFR